MLYYMLRSEDLMRGLFPRIALETLYINLYNLSQLKDVDGVIAELDRAGTKAAPQPPRPVHVAAREEAPPGPAFTRIGDEGARQAPAPVEPARSEHPAEGVHGFVEFLKKKKPFLGSMLDSCECILEGQELVVLIDKKYGNFIKSEYEEIKELAGQFFGRAMKVEFRDASDKKRNILEEYVKEAESLFNI